MKGQAKMNQEIEKLIDRLNDDDVNTRLNSLALLMERVRSGVLKKPSIGSDVNNHIHTTYSFSPYSPSKAIWMACSAGLITAGIMDHDSIGGAEEFIEAGKIAGISTTIGVECRVDFSKTRLGGRRLNNPDQDSIAYVALHGIPHTQIGKVADYFTPLILYRNIRNAKMVANINRLTASFGIALDFEKDVIPLSNFKTGGSITERHILYALAIRLIENTGKGPGLVSLLKENLGLKISAKAEGYLSDPLNPHYEYDLLGLLKGELVSEFYVDATDECPDVRDILSFSDSIGAISAYAYLGDVSDSVTGDKKAQKFEDDYIEDLFLLLKQLGFAAVTWMPSRNSMAQLNKVRKLCEEYTFFQISGEDINSPRQSFVCEAMRDKRFDNLRESTWALIGHELAATKDLAAGMFSSQTKSKYPTLDARIKKFMEMGRESGSPCPTRPKTKGGAQNARG